MAGAKEIRGKQDVIPEKTGRIFDSSSDLCYLCNQV